MMRLRGLPLLLALCLALPGCAARGTGGPAASEAPAAPAAVSFAAQVAALPEGSQPFAESPFGPVSVDVGPSYVSGLGDQCRPVRITRGTVRYKAAVCREENDAWRFIPIIFESMP